MNPLGARRPDTAVIVTVGADTSARRFEDAAVLRGPSERAVGFSIDDYDTHEAHAVLPAADPITDVSGSTIELAPGHLDLLLSAVDSATEDASIERVACIGVIDGVARLDYYSAVPDGSVPHLSGVA